MGTGIVPFIGMLQRLQNLGQSCKVTLVYGVRNNTTVCYYKDFLVQWFSKRPESQLYLACSREIVNEEVPSNVSFVKGYVQDVLSRFDLSKFQIQDEKVTQDSQVDDKTFVLICGNKNAL